MVDVKTTIKAAFILGTVGTETKFTKEELETITEWANGEGSSIMPKKDWVRVSLGEYEPDLYIHPDYVEKVKLCYNIAQEIYDQADEAGIDYVSGYEYFCLVLRTVRCLSKCAFAMDED